MTLLRQQYFEGKKNFKVFQFTLPVPTSKIIKIYMYTHAHTNYMNVYMTVWMLNV